MEHRTLQAGTDTSGLAAASFSADVLAAVYKSVLPSRAYTVDMRGHRTVDVPVYTPWSKTAALTAELAAITPSDPTFTKSTLSLSSKAAAAVQVSAEFLQDGENTSFTSAVKGIIVEALHRNMEAAAAAELFIGAVPSFNVTSGSPPSDADFAAAMGLVVPQAIGPNTAFYVHPLTWGSMNGTCDCHRPEGSLGLYRGFPVFPMYELGTASGCLGVFGDLSRGLGLALGDLSVRVLDQPLAASDQTVVQGVLRFGVKVLQSGCIATISAN